jgi:periplasmic copper chaperone A
MKIKAFIVCLLFLSLSAHADIVVKDAYVPQLPPSAKVHAVYLSITNTGEKTRTLVAVKAKGFMISHLHQTQITDGVSSMHSIHHLMIKPGETIAMEPGSLHIMLMKPSEAALLDGEVILDLAFKDGETITTIAALRAIN